MSKAIEEVLDFYKKFDLYESMSSSFIRGDGSKRQVKASEINIHSDRMDIVVNRTMSNFLLKYVSPVIKNKDDNGEMKDINKLHLALAVVKMFNEERDEWVYLPLISVDITEFKQQIMNNGIISILNDKDIIIHEDVLEGLGSNMFNESGQDKVEYIGEKFEDIRDDSLMKMMKSLYELFNFSDEFKLAVPVIKNENSACFMFFNQKDNIKTRRIYEEMKESYSPLLEKYLTKENLDTYVNKTSDSGIWLGSLTKSFPLGSGQAAVMQKNQLGESLISVAGAPGTGKTTLFLSLIAQEVTNRAINLAFNKSDYSNLMLVTSTSNKAIENVYSSLKHGFKHGFVYVGGKTSNKENSISDVQEYLNDFKIKEYNEEKLLSNKKKIQSILKTFNSKEKIFYKTKEALKELDMKIKSYSDLKNTLSEYKTLKTKMTKQSWKYLNGLSGKNIIEDVLLSDNYKFFSEKSKRGLLLRIFSPNKNVLNQFNKEFKVSMNIEDFGLYFKELNKFSISDVRNFKTSLRKDILSSIKADFHDKEKFFEGVLRYDSFVEYFRTNLFGMNYSLYIASLNYMEQTALKYKEEVIKAVSALLEPNMYNYIKENYGYREESHEKFLKYLSMAYPVVTSTLAAIGNMFSGVRCTKFNKVLADEAGMISVNHILPALNVSNSAIIVGDVKQLEAINSVEEMFLGKLKNKFSDDFWKKYSPSQVSAFHRAAGTKEGGYKVNGNGIILDEHRRCAPAIANIFIDIAEYHGLKVCTKKPNSKPFQKIGTELLFFNVKGDENSNRNSNNNEVSKISSILNRLSAIGYDLKKDIGIITPYKNQESLLIHSFSHFLNHTNESPKIGTVHKFQGTEFKVVIFSSVISKKTDNLKFINNSVSMINVSLSRAKEVFIMVGDYDKLTEDKSFSNFIGRVSKSIKEKGKYIG